MKLNYFFKVRTLLVALSLLLALQADAAQFVDLTAEIQVADWDYQFMVDKLKAPRPEEKQRSIFQPAGTIHCIVGTNSWMIENRGDAFTVQYWFTGSNIISANFDRKTAGAPSAQGQSESPRMVRVDQSTDGNPGRPVRVADILTFDIGARVAWMAFCSGSALQREGRTLNSPSDFWKESRIVDTGWKDRTTVFPDALGLPKSINLFTTNQTIFEYQVHQTTNSMGWTFPLEFYGVQYTDTGGGDFGWKVHVTIKGRITSIREGTEPKIPDEVLKQTGLLTRK